MFLNKQKFEYIVLFMPRGNIYIRNRVKMSLINLIKKKGGSLTQHCGGIAFQKTSK